MDIHIDETNIRRARDTSAAPRIGPDLRAWHEKEPSEWTHHDALYAAARQLIDRAEADDNNRWAFFEASREVMDFADRNYPRVS